MRKYRRAMGQAKAKAVNKQRLMLEAQLPMEELIAGMRNDVEAFAGELGLLIIQQVMAVEIEQKTGPWGKQRAWRYGQQPGYVIFGGRKVSLQRPRLRSPAQQEIELSSYKAFQSRGKLQEAVARQLTRQCSTRDYEGAIDSCLQG